MKTRKNGTVKLGRFCRAKNYRWLYEREWRMFAPLGKAQYDNVRAVTAVYLGSRIRDSHRDKIVDKLASLNIRA
jgi:hypothetical protein